ncbi:MAG: molecular chaperone DnaK, partial [Patescibacteria group bacterium]
KISALKSVKDGPDAGAITKAAEDLSSAMQKIGQAMYGAAGGQTPPGDAGQDGNVKDAEYKEKKDPDSE